MIKVKRVYDPPSSRDGRRFLVDRLWPRGVKRDALSLVDWLKDIAPSDTLRRWFAHDPSRWDTFQRRYAAELNRRPEVWRAAPLIYWRWPISIRWVHPKSSQRSTRPQLRCGEYRGSGPSAFLSTPLIGNQIHVCNPQKNK